MGMGWDVLGRMLGWAYWYVPDLSLASRTTPATMPSATAFSIACSKWVMLVVYHPCPILRRSSGRRRQGGVFQKSVDLTHGQLRCMGCHSAEQAGVTAVHYAHDRSRIYFGRRLVWRGHQSRRASLVGLGNEAVAMSSLDLSQRRHLVPPSHQQRISSFPACRMLPPATSGGTLVIVPDLPQVRHRRRPSNVAIRL
jgi:hypothetical protein